MATRASWLVALVACAAPTPSPVAPTPPPSAAPLTSFAQPYQFASTHPVERYGERLPAPTITPFDEAVIAATHAVADPRLFAACIDLLAVASPDAPVPNAAIVHAWTSAGIVEPPATPIIVRTADPQQLIAAMGTLPAGSHVGFAHDGELVVAVVTQPRLVVEPFDRHVPAEGAFSIAGTIVGHPADLAVDVRWHDNATMQIAPTRTRDHFAAQISCQGRPGRGEVVIAGIDRSTQTVLAKFPVWCGDAPSSEITIDPLVDDVGEIDPSALSHRLFLRLQRDRIAAGMPAQSWDDVAAKAALDHAEDFRDGVHDGRPVVWRNTKLPTPVTASNMMHAGSVDEAYAKIMADPDRRARSLSEQMNAGGVGIARDPSSGRVFVVEVFMDMTVKLDNSPIAASLERTLAAIDHDLKMLPELSGIAQEMAVMLRAGGTRADLWGILSRRGNALRITHNDRRIRFANLYFNSARTFALRKLDIIKFSAHTQIVEYAGIGVVQGYDLALGPLAVWAVIVFAQDKLPDRGPR